MYKREIFADIVRRFNEPRRFIQVLSGPRQVGKTTLASQVKEEIKMPCHYAMADEPDLKSRSWIEQEWETARHKAEKNAGKALIIIDEIQKIEGWPETVKRLWDEDTASKKKVYVMLLGSSQLLIGKGLGESLAGRFEAIHVTHWSFGEMRKAFGFGLDEYMYFGGYPGGAALIKDSGRWVGYITGSLIEATVSKDILQMTRVDKPALLKRLFQLGCAYSGQVLSYQKILGQLQDAGNTTTLAHYLDLLGGAGMLCGLQKYAGQKIRQKGSSPKFQAMNTALITAQSSMDFLSTKADKEQWGRLAESCAGAHLVNSAEGTGIDVFYWASANREVDFVLSSGEKITAIEVKSGRKKQNLPGMEAFSKEFKVNKKYLVGTGGIPFEEFFKIKSGDLF
jgi:predicted AAA+ superfamily ATPase